MLKTRALANNSSSLIYAYKTNVIHSSFISMHKLPIVYLWRISATRKCCKKNRQMQNNRYSLLDILFQDIRSLKKMQDRYRYSIITNIDPQSYDLVVCYSFGPELYSNNLSKLYRRKLEVMLWRSRRCLKFRVTTKLQSRDRAIVRMSCLRTVFMSRDKQTYIGVCIYV